MSTNLFDRLRNLLPAPGVIVGRVLEHNDDDTSTIEIPLGVGLTGYVLGLSAGSLIRPRGRSVPVGQNAFVRNGLVESQAPDGDPIDIVIGDLPCFPDPQVFVGPVDDQALTVGQPFSLDLSGLWSGGYPLYTFAIATGGLPDGVSLNVTTGVISGSPTEEFAMPNVSIARRDAAGRVTPSNTFSFTVAAAVAVFRDDFDGAAGTLAGRTPTLAKPGATWSILNGTPTLTGSGTALINSPDDALVEAAIATLLVGEVEVRFRLNSGVERLSFAVAKPAFESFIRAEVGFYNGEPAYGIGINYDYDYRFDTASPVALPGGTFAAGEWHVATMKATEAGWELRIDGVLRASMTGMPATLGDRTWANAGVQVALAAGSAAGVDVEYVLVRAG